MLRQIMVPRKIIKGSQVFTNPQKLQENKNELHLNNTNSEKRKEGNEKGILPDIFA
jgi:hypothetical protein